MHPKETYFFDIPFSDVSVSTLCTPHVSGQVQEFVALDRPGSGIPPLLILNMLQNSLIFFLPLPPSTTICLACPS